MFLNKTGIKATLDYVLKIKNRRFKPIRKILFSGFCLLVLGLPLIKSSLVYSAEINFLKSSLNSNKISSIIRQTDTKTVKSWRDFTDTPKTGLQEFDGKKYFLDLNGDITTGIVTIPYRGMKDHKVTYYFLDVPGEEYGQMYKGQLKNKDGSYSFFRLSDGVRVENDFYNNGENWIYADENGKLKTGIFRVGDQLYMADVQGRILTRNEKTLNSNVIEETNDMVRLWVKGKWIEAEADTLRAELLKAAAGLVAHVVYTAHGREGDYALDCLGFASYVHSKVNQVELNLPNCNETMINADSYGKIIPLNDLQVGDLIMYKSTFAPANIYTHAAVYIGNGEILSLANDGVDCVRIEDIKDWFGNPAPWTGFRLNS
ncbi:NlpC/P60 family protein [Ileibacterium valens]|uniref:NlpC/P60 domain-containing protein n=1 Tax=Ileibacterium valens TaxID=1862668 RepID=A0A1U7NFN6_9FIRM|nr:NlpC/P60 family protein [Ileibacterium valens]OLU39082.1 hypothetical protein BO222_07325 [Ileibacterium valens]OLU41731.1 hypothetical protein BM735_03740 [Erysipelotrichaceae bacterium NYU-BL-F16]OLU41820.1 hypothetical protein BO224_02925 [Erysipelotrichaceae bacterium NYU-BL-E8]